MLIMKSTILVTPFYQSSQYSSVQFETAKWQKIPKDHVVIYVNSHFRCIESKIMHKQKKQKWKYLVNLAVTSV